MKTHTPLALVLGLAAALVVPWYAPGPVRAPVMPTLEIDAVPPAETPARLARTTTGLAPAEKPSADAPPGKAGSRAPSMASRQAAPGQASHPVYQYKALMSPDTDLSALQSFLPRVAASNAWASAANNPGVQPVIAVIDTGFNLAHQDLAPRLTAGYDFYHNDGNPNAGSTNPGGDAVAHGTLTAGLVALMDPVARIMPLQALDDDGNGDTNTVAAAVRYAADNGADVISMSLGSEYDDNYLRNQIKYAIGRGVLVIAAAGNDGCNCLSYPAAYPEVLGVGASDAADNRAGFSSYGANLDVLAPGTAFDVCSATYGGAAAYTCGYSGTSLSTPIVAGIAGLLLNQDPDSSPDDLTRFIVKSARKTAAMGGKLRTPTHGYGIVNAKNALAAASLAAPVGALANKQSASLTASTTANGPAMSSTCRGLPDTACTFKLGGPAGANLTLGAVILDEDGNGALQWDAAEEGLAAGQWQITATQTANGQTRTSPPYTITISP